MKRLSIIPLAVLAVTGWTTVRAQDSLLVRLGDRVRVMAPGVLDGLGSVTVVAVKPDTLVVRREPNTWYVPLSAITKLEVSTGALSGTGAAIGAAVGAVAMLAIRSGAGWGVVVSLSSIAVGAMLGTSPTARKGGGIGLLFGATVGAATGAILCVAADCDEFEAGIILVGLSGIGAAGGLFIGALTGMVSSHRWRTVPLDRLRVSVAPQRDGRFGLGLSVRF